MHFQMHQNRIIEDDLKMMQLEKIKSTNIYPTRNG